MTLPHTYRPQAHLRDLEQRLAEERPQPELERRLQGCLPRVEADTLTQRLSVLRNSPARARPRGSPAGHKWGEGGEGRSRAGRGGMGGRMPPAVGGEGGEDFVSGNSSEWEQQ